MGLQLGVLGFSGGEEGGLGCEAGGEEGVCEGSGGVDSEGVVRVEA